jgi:hypothetical protein
LGGISLGHIIESGPYAFEAFDTAGVPGGQASNGTIGGCNLGNGCHITLPSQVGGPFWGKDPGIIVAQDDKAPKPSISHTPICQCSYKKWISDKQLGKKFERHKDPKTPGYRTVDEYLKLAEDIYNDPDATRTTYDSGPYRGETHIQQGNNLLRLDPNGNFRSLYPLSEPEP